MYCKKCGKFIYTDDDYCSDCAPKETPVALPIAEEPTPEPVVISQPTAESVYTPAEQSIKPKREGRVMDGFGPALTSTILSNISYALAYVAYLFLAMDGVLGSFFDGDITGIAIKAICAIYIVIAIGLAIPSLVMGIKSIKFFRSAVANKRAKPVPALILGICGTAMSASALLVSVAAFMMFVASLLMKL